MNHPETKKICFFNSCKIWGGGEKWHFDIACRFRQKGYSVSACTNSKSELYYRFRQAGIHVNQIRIHNLSFLNPFKIYRIYRFFVSGKTDTVILGLPSDVKAAGIAAKLAGVKKIIYRRGTALPVKNSIINRFLFKYVITDVITNSIEIKKKFLQNNSDLFPSNHIHVIYNGINIHDNFRKTSLNGFPRKVIIGNAGRLVEQKGQKYLIELAAVLQSRGIDFVIRVAGKGILRDKLTEYSEKLHVSDKIEFMGFVRDMNGFFKDIDVFVLPSIHEGSANIVIEAMAHSIPVVAFDTSSLPELIDNGKTGFLVPFGDVNQLADKIMEIIDHQTIYRMGKAAHELVVRKFDVNTSILQLEEII